MISRPQRVLSVLVLFSLLGCNGKSEAPPSATPPPQADVKAPAGPPPSAHEAKPKTPPPAAADPHAGAAANPHGAMPTAAPSGPPREIEPSGEVVETTIGGLKLKVPKEWENSPAAGSMRLGQFVLPGPGGDAELVLFRFPGGAGGVEANIARWKGQFAPPEGKTIDDVSSVKNLTAGDLKITVLDVQGRSQGSMGAPAPAGEEHRMLAAIVEGQGDPYFLKALGPEKTLAIWAPAFDQVLQNLSVE